MSDQAAPTIDRDEPSSEEVAPRTLWQEWRLPLVLFVLTFFSMLFVGAQMEGVDPLASSTGIFAGWPFAVPMMAILLSHELGHYVAGRIHRVDISPPYFIPVPIFLLGTMGAVIHMRGAIRRRNALLDVGAAGPIAGMVIALPVLIYGIATSDVEPLPADGSYILEGHSLLYELLLFVLKGPIPAGEDIMLSSTALAGWAGLLVTMINLIPCGQLDGGHIAYALLGEPQDRISSLVLKLLPVLALVVAAYYGGQAYLAGQSADRVIEEAMAGMPWAVWAVLLAFMGRASGGKHPPTEDQELSPKRRLIAISTLILFALLFMPSWVRQHSAEPSGEAPTSASSAPDSISAQTTVETAE